MFHLFYFGYVNKGNMADNSFENILAELKNSATETVKGNYVIREITLKQQRKILNGGFEAVEMPAKLANIYNDYIRESVVRNDSMVDISQVVTVDIKPYLLIELRRNTFGDTYYGDGDEDDEVENKEYKLYEVIAKDLESAIKPVKVKFGNVTIKLDVPTIEKESKYNSLLISTGLSSFKKKKIDESTLAQVADVYQLYEMMKYISTIVFDGVEYDFDKVAMAQKMRFLDMISPTIVNNINKFIKKVKKSEEKAFRAIADDGDEITLGTRNLFMNNSKD